jgi:cyclophilin family peptidyl-prolyl cis-trans isomerase/tetratricopeptide (TPR) repeat protein
MRTRLSLFCDKVIEAGWLTALVIVPLFFDIYSQRVFEPDKISLLRSVALVMSAAWLLRVLEDWRSGRPRPSPLIPGEMGFLRRLVKTPMVLPTLLVVLVYLLSTMLSVDRVVSFLGSYQRLQGTYTTLSYVVIFFLVLEGLRTRRQLDRIVTTAIVVSFPIAMYGLVQHFGLDPLPWGGNVTTRVASNMGNPIFVAGYLIMIVPFTASRLLANWKTTAGDFDWRDGLLGLASFLLLAAALVAAMFGRQLAGGTWLGWAALLLGLGLQVPIYLLISPERRNSVLSICLPLTFASLVAMAWVQEIIFPPAAGGEAPIHLWLGLAAAVVFVLAMVALAYYLRRPVASLLLLAAYFIVLVAQVVCILYTQSRGPLLGLLAAVYVYLAELGLIRGRVRWLSWATIAIALLAVAWLVVFNVAVDVPLVERLREAPYVGRLGKVLQTEEGTGKVRVLIWQGVVEMVSPHTPLQTPDGKPDALNAVRPLFGYGPESMYVAYNRFYPPDLAHYEKRNASPDRSHNETFDALAQTGIVGLLAYTVLFASVFYYALTWLELVRQRWQKWTFLGLWVGGGLLGALLAWLWRGPVYLGVGIPFGEVAGLAIYLIVVIVAAAVRHAFGRISAGPQALLLLALLSALLAHFVEIHFGIAIASTRYYFWLYTALLVVVGIRLSAEPEPNGVLVETGVQPVTQREQAQRGAPVPSVQKVRGAKRQAPRAQGKPSARKSARSSEAAVRGAARQHEDSDWWGSVLVLSLIVFLILSTMCFNYVITQEGNPGALATLWQSLTRNGDTFSPVMLVLFFATWALAALVGMGDLATRDDAKGRKPVDWLKGLGIYALISLVGAWLFGLLHAARLKPVMLESADAPNPMANTITFYYVVSFLVIVGLALVLTFLFRRSVAAWKMTGRLPDLAVIVALIILPAVALVLVYVSNVEIVRADILYKQGLSSEKAGDWDGAIFFYDKSIELEGRQDFYYLFLGRALMEKARKSTGQAQTDLFQQSESALLAARQIAPLNTDHSANLARLYRTWGGLSQDPLRTQLLNKALDYYADATSLSPNSAQLLDEWGQTFEALGQVEEALAKYEQSLTLDDVYPQTYLLLGALYVNQGQWDQAAQALERAVQLNAKTTEAWSSLGYVYSQQNDLPRAVDAYEKAAALSPTSFTNRKNLALVYQATGRRDDALREANAALKLASQDQKPAIEVLIAELTGQYSDLSAADAQELQTLIDRGQTLLGSEDWVGAQAAFQQALEIDPKNAQAHSGLSYAYAKQGKLDEAIAEGKAVLAVLPDDYTSFKNLAVFYQQKGMLPEALDAAQRALALAPEADRAVLQAFIDQLQPPAGTPTVAPASTATPTSPETRAGDLPPAERNDMYTSPPSMTIDPARSYTATLVTDKGDIVVALDAASAPQTVNNFVFLAQQGFYDGLTFHRVESQSGFSLIQGGDPTGTGRGGPGYTVPAEIGLSHKAGAIAMARLPDQVNPRRDSSGSQFYICRVPITQLDGAYTVFGYVTQGLDVAKQIAVGDKILRVEISVQ